MKIREHNSKYFCGNKISEYGLENGYIDYATFAKSFDAVLVNDITRLFYASLNHEYIEPEQIHGYIDNSEQIEELRDKIEELEDILNLDENDNTPSDELLAQIDELNEQIEELEREQDEQPEIYQYFIVSRWGADLIQDYTNDPLYYIEAIDAYIWGVTHWGTSWDYVLTDIKLNLEDNEQ